MARGGQDAHAHRGRDLDDVSVADGGALERDRVGGVDVIGRAGGLGKGQPAGEVVVVDVRLKDVGDAHTGLVGDGEHSVDVALGVHDHGHLAVVREVGAVAEGGRLDGEDHWAGAHGCHRSTPGGIFVKYPPGYRCSTHDRSAP